MWLYIFTQSSPIAHRRGRSLCEIRVARKCLNSCFTLCYACLHWRMKALKQLTTWPYTFESKMPQLWGMCITWHPPRVAVVLVPSLSMFQTASSLVSRHPNCPCLKWSLVILNYAPTTMRSVHSCVSWNNKSIKQKYSWQTYAVPAQFVYNRICRKQEQNVSHDIFHSNFGANRFDLNRYFTNHIIMP